MGYVDFLLRIPGSKFDLMTEMQKNNLSVYDDMSPDADDVINNIFLQRFRNRLRYAHRDGYNFILIAAVKSPYESLIITLEAIVLAVIAGLLLKNYATGEFCTAFSENVLVPVRSTLTNAMKVTAVPLAFFSLVTSIARFGNLGNMRRISLRCLSCFFPRRHFQSS